MHRFFRGIILSFYHLHHHITRIPTQTNITQSSYSTSQPSWINITYKVDAFNYHPQSSWLILSWTDGSTLSNTKDPSIYLHFKHNIPQYRPHLLATRDCNYAAGDFPSLANATSNVPNTAYHSKTPSESTLCVVCCLVPVLIMLHACISDKCGYFVSC